MFEEPAVDLAEAGEDLDEKGKERLRGRGGVFAPEAAIAKALEETGSAGVEESIAGQGAFPARTGRGARGWRR